VAAVGWSYGGSVISLATAGEGSITHLIYIADIPRPAGYLAKILAGSMPIRMFSFTPTEDSCPTQADRPRSRSKVIEPVVPRLHGTTRSPSQSTPTRKPTVHRALSAAAVCVRGTASDSYLISLDGSALTKITHGA
jgi:hypothetical protein